MSGRQIGGTVIVPWYEWHELNEDAKEARRLLKLTLEADRRGDSIDRGQIEGFLGERPTTKRKP